MSRHLTTAELARAEELLAIGAERHFTPAEADEMVTLVARLRESQPDNPTLPLAALLAEIVRLGVRSGVAVP